MAPPAPSVRELLAAAVAGVGGSERPGQVADGRGGGRRHDRRRAPARPGRHRHRQVAGLPGAGAAARRARGRRATATIALQNQLVDRDLPRLVDAVEPLLGRRPTFAILKGRSNYLCLQQGARRDARRRRATRCSTRRRTTALGRRRGAAARLGRRDRDRRPRRARSRASTTGPGGRSASPRASASARRSARTARSASPSWPATGRARPTIVVTNHALLAIDALESFAGAARARRGGRRRGARAGRPGHRRWPPTS